MESDQVKRCSCICSADCARAARPPRYRKTGGSANTFELMLYTGDNGAVGPAGNQGRSFRLRSTACFHCMFDIGNKGQTGPIGSKGTCPETQKVVPKMMPHLRAGLGPRGNTGPVGMCSRSGSSFCQVTSNVWFTDRQHWPSGGSRTAREPRPSGNERYVCLKVTAPQGDISLPVALGIVGLTGNQGDKGAPGVQGQVGAPGRFKPKPLAF
jgi:hypothetical protein